MDATTGAGLKRLERWTAYMLAISPPIGFVLTVALAVCRRHAIALARDEPWTLRVLIGLGILGLAGAIGAAHPWTSVVGIASVALLFWYWAVGRFTIAAPRQFSVDLQRAIGITALLTGVVAITGWSYHLRAGAWTLALIGPENKGTVLGLGGNGLGPLLVFGGILALARAFEERRLLNRIESLAIAGVSLVAPLLLNVRNALWGTAAGVIALAPLAGFWVILVAGAAAGLAFELRPGVWARLLALRPDTEQERLGVWRSGLAMIRDHPWLGVGPNHFASAHSAYATPPSAHLSDPHNIYLRVASEWGLPAALLLFGWVIAWGVAAWRRHPDPFRRALLAGVLSFLAMGVFDTPLFTFHISGPVMVGLGLAAARTPSAEGEPAQDHAEAQTNDR